MWRGMWLQTFSPWFRAFIRLVLAAEMLGYGIDKTVLVQFPSPSLVALVRPIGLLPRTALAGALLSLADLIHAVTINLAYGVGLTGGPISLAAMTLFLIAPEARRLADAFVFNRAVGPRPSLDLFRTKQANRIALVAQLALGGYVIGQHAFLARRPDAQSRGPRSPLYGIWNVDSSQAAGAQGWRRVIFDAPGTVIVQTRDDAFMRYGAAIDAGAGTLTITRPDQSPATLSYRRPSDNRLVIDGAFGNVSVHLPLHRVELDTFPLVNSTFRWVREAD